MPETLRREANPPSGQLAAPLPQAWDPSILDFRKLTGRLVEDNANPDLRRFAMDVIPWSQTAGGVWVPGQVNAQLSGRKAEDVTLQNAATAPGDGTPYAPSTTSILTFEIRGTSTSRTVVFELAGPSGTYVPCQAVRLSDYAMASYTSGGNDAAPESWQVEVPAGWSFRARISEVSGGTVTVVGKVVAV